MSNPTEPTPLKPCPLPLCGGEANSYLYDYPKHPDDFGSPDFNFVIWCDACGLRLEESCGNLDEEEVKARLVLKWNTRTSDAELSTLKEKLALYEAAERNPLNGRELWSPYILRHDLIPINPDDGMRPGLIQCGNIEYIQTVDYWVERQESEKAQAELSTLRAQVEALQPKQAAAEKIKEELKAFLNEEGLPCSPYSDWIAHLRLSCQAMQKEVRQWRNVEDALNDALPQIEQIRETRRRKYSALAKSTEFAPSDGVTEKGGEDVKA